MNEKASKIRLEYLSIIYIVVLGLWFTAFPDSVLNSFLKMRDTFNEARLAKEQSVNAMFLSFEETKLKDEPQRAAPLYERAKRVQGIIDIQQTKIDKRIAMLTQKAGGSDPETGDVKRKDNTDIVPRFMLKSGDANQLKQELRLLEKKVLSFLDTESREKVSLSLSPKDPEKRLGKLTSWEQQNFGDGTPVTAALTNLTRIQADLSNAKGDVIKAILGNMDKAVVNLDQFSAVAVAPSSYIISGQPYSAEVFLTASDSKSSARVSVNGADIPVRNGKGAYSVSTSKEGIYTWTGSIAVKQADGAVKTYRTSPQTYQVAKPSAVVSATKMNVLYIGVDNPIDVSAPGIAKDNVRLSITGGSLVKAGSGWVARVNVPGVVKFNVGADVNGKTQTISSAEFRVKKVPAPSPKFGGKSGGTMATVAIKSQNKVFAKLENFDFDANFDVTGFTMILVKPGDNATVLSTTGNSLSSVMKSAIQAISPGTRVIFDNIKASGPGGASYTLDPIALTAI